MIKTASILGFWNNSLLKNAMRPRPPLGGPPPLGEESIPEVLGLYSEAVTRPRNSRMNPLRDLQLELFKIPCSRFPFALY